MSRFDHIPAGKKEVFNLETGEYMLVDLTESDNIEDMQIILAERNSEIKSLHAEIKKRDEVIEQMNAKIIFLESAGKKK